jgi:exonuclease VII small subunit
MPTITITGDTTQKALERFENQNKEIKECKQKLNDAYAKLGALDASDD